MYKKIISAIAIIAILSLMPISVHANTKLSDVNNHWAKASIEEFVNKGYINGYEDNTFKPDNSITRAEFIKIVNKYFGYKYYSDRDYSNINQGYDVSKNDWFYKDICAARTIGYINGYSDGTMKPNSYITREEAAKIISTIKYIYDEDLDKINNFNDRNNISKWADGYVEGVVEAGYFKGDYNKNLNPKKNITRAEAVTMLARVDNNSEIEFSNSKQEFKNTLVNNGFIKYSDVFGLEIYHFNGVPGDISIDDAGSISISYDFKNANNQLSTGLRNAIKCILPTGGEQVYNIVKDPLEEDQVLNLDNKTVNINHHGYETTVFITWEHLKFIG